jgi:hypothetical protein
MTKRDAAAREIVWRQLDHDPIPWQHADVVLSHLAAEVTEHRMPIFQLDREHGVRERFHYLPIHGNGIWILPAHPFFRRVGCNELHRTRWLPVLGLLCQRSLPRNRRLRKSSGRSACPFGSLGERRVAASVGIVACYTRQRHLERWPRLLQNLAKFHALVICQPGVSVCFDGIEDCW